MVTRAAWNIVVWMPARAKPCERDRRVKLSHAFGQDAVDLELLLSHVNMIWRSVGLPVVLLLR